MREVSDKSVRSRVDEYKVMLKLVTTYS